MHGPVVNILFSPGKLRGVVNQKVPVHTQVRRVLHLFIDLAFVLIFEVSASGPDGGQGPVAFDGVEHEIVDFAAVVQRLECSSTILTKPVDPRVPEEKHQVRIHGRIFDVEHIANLTPLSLGTDVFVVLFQLPIDALVSTPIDSLVLSQNQQKLVLLATPHLLDDLRIGHEVEDVQFLRRWLISFFSQILHFEIPLIGFLVNQILLRIPHELPCLGGHCPEG